MNYKYTISFDEKTAEWNIADYEKGKHYQHGGFLTKQEATAAAACKNEYLVYKRVFYKELLLKFQEKLTYLKKYGCDQ